MAPNSKSATIKTDIVVIGSGIGGFCAAVGAAEAGCDVVIVEARGQIGGNATQANVGTVCGAFYSGQHEAQHPVGYDFTVSLVVDLCARSGTTLMMQENGLTFAPYEWTVLQDMMLQQIHDKDINLLTGATLVNTESAGDKICRLTIALAG